MANSNSVEDRYAKRTSVIDSMISSIRNREEGHYFVGLVGYYIEGIRYFASGLSVDLSRTPDICRTDAGFACSVMFPANMLDLQTVRAKGITNIRLGGQAIDAVLVRLEVLIDDIWLVAEFVDGRQHDLFIDSEVAKSNLHRSRSNPH
jgi:hypothetical protein